MQSIDKIDGRVQLAASGLDSGADGKATGLEQSRGHHFVNTIAEADLGSCPDTDTLETIEPAHNCLTNQSEHVLG